MHTRSKTRAMASSDTDTHGTNNVSLGIQSSSPDRGDADADQGDHAVLAQSGSHAVAGDADARASGPVPGSPHFAYSNAIQHFKF